MDIKVIYNFLMVVGGLIALYSVFVFMPMFFTYLSDGDMRAPGVDEIKSGQSVAQLHAKKYANQ